MKIFFENLEKYSKISQNFKQNLWKSARNEIFTLPGSVQKVIVSSLYQGLCWNYFDLEQSSEKCGLPQLDSVTGLPEAIPYIIWAAFEIFYFDDPNKLL